MLKDYCEKFVYITLALSKPLYNKNGLTTTPTSQRFNKTKVRHIDNTLSEILPLLVIKDLHSANSFVPTSR